MYVQENKTRQPVITQWIIKVSTYITDITYSLSAYSNLKSLLHQNETEIPLDMIILTWYTIYMFVSKWMILKTCVRVNLLYPCFWQEEKYSLLLLVLVFSYKNHLMKTTVERKYNLSSLHNFLWVCQYFSIYTSSVTYHYHHNDNSATFTCTSLGIHNYPQGINICIKSWMTTIRNLI